jgi:hypothetical protein
VEIETLNAEAEVEQLYRIAEQLDELKTQGRKEALDVYRRNVRLNLLGKAQKIFKEVDL